MLRGGNKPAAAVVSENLTPCIQPQCYSIGTLYICLATDSAALSGTSTASTYLLKCSVMVRIYLFPAADIIKCGQMKSISQVAQFVVGVLGEFNALW